MLTLTAPPANDNYSGRVVVSGASGSVAGTNVFASGDATESTVFFMRIPTDIGTVMSRADSSVWYKYTATTNGRLRLVFDTSATNFEPIPLLLSDFDGTAASLDMVGRHYRCNGDGSVNASAPYCTQFDYVKAGTTYAIAVTGTSTYYYQNALTPSGRGDFRLTWTRA